MLVHLDVGVCLGGVGSDGTLIKSSLAVAAFSRFDESCRGKLGDRGRFGVVVICSRTSTSIFSTAMISGNVFDVSVI